MRINLKNNWQWRKPEFEYNLFSQKGDLLSKPLLYKDPLRVNKVASAFQRKSNANLLSVYFTAGSPSLSSTTTIIKELENAGADMIEIGIPSTNPKMDGEVIRKSHAEAIMNGMSLSILLTQLESIKNKVSIPLVLIGYIDSILDFGMERFCKRCKEAGVGGVIIPDMDVNNFKTTYQNTFKRYSISNIFLITPDSTDEEIMEADQLSKGFVYLVSTKGTTGARPSITDDQTSYFSRVRKMKLKNKTLIGFGISNSSTFRTACKYAEGAIIGSAFVKILSESNNCKKDIRSFIKSIREE